ncbi:MAG TPA: dephospho-CoA kinase [Vicinamibacterales bacterium]|nr:dephospho-CoA kinase [Vicinamibacterales bacterium]
MKRIALTGGMGTGKSHVRAVFAALGVPTIDADTLARDVVAHGTPGFEAVVGKFGRGILNTDGDLDRRALGALVFADAGKRHELEAILHPAIKGAIDQWFTTLDQSAQPFAIADIPLLYEVGLDKEYDAVIVTACTPQNQVRRIMARDNLDATEVQRRLEAQLPIEEKVKRANYVVDTNGSLVQTNAQVHKLYQQLSAG